MNDHGEAMQLVVGGALIVWGLVCAVTLVFCAAQMVRAWQMWRGR